METPLPSLSPSPANALRPLLLQEVCWLRLTPLRSLAQTLRGEHDLLSYVSHSVSPCSTRMVDLGGSC